MTLVGVDRPQVEDVVGDGPDECPTCGHGFAGKPVLRGLRQRIGLSASVRCEDPAEWNGTLILSESCGCSDAFHTRD